MLPPPGVTLALPVLEHAIELLIKVVLAVTAGAWVMVIVAVAEQLLLSVTVTVYVPPDKPVAVELVCPPGAHE